MEFTAGDDIKKAGGRDPGAYEAERLISAIPGMDARGGASIASVSYLVCTYVYLYAYDPGNMYLDEWKDHYLWGCGSESAPL